MTERFFGEANRPQIYAYTQPQFADTPWTGAKTGKGLLKVGYTTKNVQARVREQFPTIQPEEHPYQILLEEVAIDAKGRYFTDHLIHRILANKGFTRVRGEWFECTVDDVRAAINEAKLGLDAGQGRPQAFAMRPEQAAAVTQTKAYFEEWHRRGEKDAPRFLWNAKMRFGKTFATYQLARQMGWEKILVLTYKPAVEGSWRADLMSHQDFSDWRFIGNNETFEKEHQGQKIVWFSSFQNILGRDREGRIKGQHEIAHLIEWDCVVLDEYHFGAWRETAKELYSEDARERAAEMLEEVELDEDLFLLTARHFLYLSGTPFRALSQGEFMEDQIYSWTYTDEQRAKANWSDSNGPNPYAPLPTMTLMTYQLPNEVRRAAMNTDSDEFDLNEFFRAVGPNDPPNENGEAAEGSADPTTLPGTGDFHFVHEEAVQKWLHLIRGSHLSGSGEIEPNRKSPPLPFEDRRLEANLRHTIWFLNSVASCKAMANLLKQPQNSYYHDFQIVVVAGDVGGVGAKALEPVEAAIGNGFSRRTITLSCGKLMTGVTVPPWSGIFMLRSMSSPEGYFQAAFRVQNPWVVRNQTGMNPNDEEIIKTHCHVFDYDPNRALKQLAEYCSGLELGSDSMDSKVSEFINFLPVLSYDGSTMTALDANAILQIAATGVGATMLARKWQSATLVNVDNEALKRLMACDSVLETIKNIEGYRNLASEIETVISREAALKKKKKERQGKNEPETPDEVREKKELSNLRKEIREKLLKFVTRVPLFMYTTDFREETLQHVIEDIEPELFQRVTNLRKEDFQALCELQVFNPTIMSQAILSFRVYEEKSLRYAGDDRELPSQYGGFDTILPREEIFGESEKKI